MEYVIAYELHYSNFKKMKYIKKQRNVIKSANPEIFEKWAFDKKQSWNKYELQNVTTLSTLSATDLLRKKTEFVTSFNTFEKFDTFIIKTQNLRPLMHNFDSMLNAVRMRERENPCDVFIRTSGYFQTINRIIRLINAAYKDGDNAIIHNALHEYDESKIMIHFQRIYCRENNKEEFKNKSWLNGKVEIKMFEYFAHAIQSDLTQNTPSALYKFLNSFVKKLIPDFYGSINSADPRRTWKPYKVQLLFNINGKRQSENKKDGGPAKKMRKHAWSNAEPCRYGKNCNNLANGFCEFRHTFADLKAAKMRNKSKQPSNKGQYNKYRSTNSQNRRSNRRPNNRRPNDTTYKKVCNRGQSCIYFQQGTCNFYHDKRQMYCAVCKNKGHASVDCRTKKQTGKEIFGRYDPKKQINANTSLREIS